MNVITTPEQRGQNLSTYNVVNDQAWYVAYVSVGAGSDAISYVVLPLGAAVEIDAVVQIKAL